jgi:hypothetical protein
MSRYSKSEAEGECGPAENQRDRPSTPIAAELYEHFERGGSIADGVRLVESLERASRRSESAPRGSRLSANWQPSRVDIVFALDRGLPRAGIDIEAEKFRNYWIAKSGKDAAKRDWPATWRNWIIKTMEKGNGLADWGQGPGTDFAPRRASSGYDPTLAGVARFAAKRGLFGGPERK